MVPAELKQLPQWIVWRLEERKGKPTKVPYRADGQGLAAVDAPQTWATARVAYERLQTQNGHRFDGLGFVVTSDDPYCGIDLDHCRDPETATTEEWAMAIVRRFHSYTEITPSQTGLRIWVKGKLPGKRSRKADIEVYDHERYFTTTGQHLPTTPETIEERQEELDAFYGELFPPQKERTRAPTGGGGMDAYTIQELARQHKNAAKFERLMRGDISGYDSASEADLALASVVAFYTDDAAVVEQIIRGSSLWDEKWERQDYRDRTITKAIQERTERYTPPLVLNDGNDESQREAPAPSAAPTRMPFPLEALPNELAAWVEEAARALKTPPDFPGLASLVFASAAIGASRELIIKPGWRERCAIWGAIVGPPGLAKKTPSLQMAVDPISKVQRDWLREHRSQLDRYEEELEEWESRPKKDRGGAKPERPVGRRLLISDTTVEKLAELLNENPRGLVLHRDELAGWVGSMDQYKKNGQGSDREHYLSMWAGVDIVVDRKINPIPISVTHPFLSVIGGIQPDLVTGLRQRMRDDGFTDRILFSWPEVLADQTWSEASVSSRAWSDYYTLFNRLLALQMEEEEQGYLRPRALQLSPAAKAAWVGFYDEHAAETQDMNLDPRMLGIYQKLISYAGRFALLHHLISQTYDPGDGEAEVSELSVTSGWALADYFKAHAGYVYGLFGRGEEDSRAEQLVAWLRRHDGVGTHRDVVRAGAAGVKKTSEALTLFRDLQDRGWAVMDEVPTTGGKQYRIRLPGSKP